MSNSNIFSQSVTSLHPLLYPSSFPYTTLFRSSVIIISGGNCSNSFSASAPLLASMVVCLSNRNRQSISRRRSEEHTSELQSPCNIVCRLLLEYINFLSIHCSRSYYNCYICNLL